MDRSGRSSSRRTHRRPESRNGSKNANGDVVKYETYKMEKRKIKYEGGNKKYEQVHIKERTAVIRGKNQLENVSSESASGSSSVDTYPDFSDEERKKKVRSLKQNPYYHFYIFLSLITVETKIMISETSKIS